MKTKSIFISIVFLTLFYNSYGTIYNWTGSVDSSFTNPGNWGIFSPSTSSTSSPSATTGYPGSGDIVIIGSATKHPVLTSNYDIERLEISSGTLDLNGYELTLTGSGLFEGGVVENGTLVIRGKEAFFLGAMLDVILDVNCDRIILNSSTFNQICIFTSTGESNSVSEGGCIFNGEVVITHTGDKGNTFRLATVNGDEFNGDVIFTNQSDAMLSIAESGDNYFNGNIEINNTGTHMIIFGYRSGGLSILAEDMTISIGSEGYSANELILVNFKQTGSTEQIIAITDEAILHLNNCEFDGNTTLSAPELLVDNCTFNGEANLTKTGSGRNYWRGGNIFNGSTTIHHEGSPEDSDDLRLVNDNSNSYNSNVTFKSEGKPIMVVNSGWSEVKGNISINDPAITFSDGFVNFVGENEQALSGTETYQFSFVTIDKTGGGVTLQTPASISSSLTFTEGHFVTDSTNILTFLAGSEANGAHNGSFVSGPVKKVGDTEFEFPVGKGIHYGPIGISAPDSITDLYIAEYFNYGQTLGSSIDSTLNYVNLMNYWSLNRMEGNSSVTLKLTWNKNIYNFGWDSLSLSIVHWDSTKWVSTANGIVSLQSDHLSLETLFDISTYGFFTIANTSSGGSNSGFITEDYKVQIWGSPHSGELGDCQWQSIAPTFTFSNPTPLSNTAYCSSPFDLEGVKKLSIGNGYSHALLCNNTIVSWGSNAVHQIGDPEPSINFPNSLWSLAAVPVCASSAFPVIDILEDIIDVEAGAYGSLALSKDGHVYYWGADIIDLADPLITPIVGSGSGIPEILRYANNTVVEGVIDVAAGYAFFLALLRDGTVLSWGRNKASQLGSGNNNGSIFPVNVVINGGTHLSQIKNIAAGYEHSMAIDINGVVYVWGGNPNGELGIGISNVNLDHAVPLTGIPAISGISAGKNHSVCFAGNNIYAWGNNSFNQLGLSAGGIATSSLVPINTVLPSGIANIVNIESGDHHNIAFTEDSKLYAWGNGDEGQLAILPINLITNTPSYTSPVIDITNPQSNAFPIGKNLIVCDQLINYCYYDFEITTAVVWPTTLPICYQPNQFLIENELLIRRGGSLTINSGTTLSFGPNGRIVLEEGDGTDAGAQLILNSGAVLTAASYCMWKGIEVRGNSAFTSTNTRQAKVIINSGAVIEHAHNAVTLGKWDENYYACYESFPTSTNPSGFDLTGSGGQVECDDATFQHNAIDIRFALYSKWSASFIENSHFLGGLLRDIRYLTNFGTSTNPFYAATNPAQRASIGIYQWETFVANVEGNDFDNYETALQMTDSRLKVIGNSFTDCRIGINSISTVVNLNHGGFVEGNTFTNVRTQIRATGGAYMNIKNLNEFNPGPLPGTQQDNLFGIFLNQERAFAIQDNNFTRLRYGIVSTNSGRSGGQINYLGQGNIFTECWRSIHLQQNHQNLRIRCNNYDNQTGTQYNSNWLLIGGVILGNQGWPSLVSDKTQAGNRFLQSPDFNELTSLSQNPFTYFRHSSPDEVIPAAAGTGIINLNANSIAMSDFDDACEPVIIPPGGDPDRISLYTSTIDSLYLELDTLTAMLDNNLTDSLLAIIHTMYDQDTIMDRLRSNIPLSDTVLIKAINSPEALNDSALFEVLYINSPYSDEVLEALNERDPELSEELRYELNHVQGLNQPYVTITGLTKEIHYVVTEKRLLINDYVSRLVADDSTQKAIHVLETEGSFEDLQTVFGSYLTMGELDSASVKLEMLMNHTDAEEDWLELHVIHLNLANEYKTWFDIDTTQESTIRNIATQEENTLAKVHAQNVLNLVYRDTFPDYVNEEEYYLRQQQPVVNSTLTKRTNSADPLTIIPNPANSFITIKLEAAGSKEYHLEIIDITGKMLFQSIIDFEKNACNLNVEFLNSGLYLIRVYSSTKMNLSSKLMIMR